MPTYVYKVYTKVHYFFLLRGKCGDITFVVLFSGTRKKQDIFQMALIDS
jgi:hypothetical protein